MPGDIDDDEHKGGILEQGKHEFEIQFCVGEVTLKVTGDLGWHIDWLRREIKFHRGQKD